MIFNNHSNLEGQHAFLGASKYHWINYDETKVADAYSKFLATQRGTVLHDFACQCITLGQKLPKSQKTLKMLFILLTHVIMSVTLSCSVRPSRSAISDTS